jgi:hypothetical protein
MSYFELNHLIKNWPQKKNDSSGSMRSFKIKAYFIFSIQIDDSSFEKSSKSSF